MQESSSSEPHLEDVPISKALSTYEEVLAWQKHVTPHETLPLQSRTQFSWKGADVCCHLGPHSQCTLTACKNVPKTLVCHDYKGGYGEDKYINGTSKHDAYRFFHWAGVDTFVYFSHKLITIPPPGWINAGHLHGVKVLGTMITEWKEGEEIWNKILLSEETRQSFISCLIDISDSFGFDGYLLNVENVLQQEQVKKMVSFIRELQEGLKSRLPHSEVIWYDSVTGNGELKWQNELNDRNSVFFDHCDGIFLNYCWTKTHLENSKNFAGARLKDIYVGVDVFGRNCFSGGGFNTSQALEVIRKHNLSVAVFAPGWVHETLDTTHFTCLEYIFWQRLWPHLFIHGPAHLPFSTSFCQGFGLKLYKNGNVISSEPWYNLALQQYQPSISSCLKDCCCLPSSTNCKEENRGCIQHFNKDAFDGGGCLKISKEPHLCEEVTKHRLLFCSFCCEGPINIVTVTKVTPPASKSIELLLLVEDSSGTCREIPVREDAGYCVDRCPDSDTWVRNGENHESSGWIARCNRLEIHGTVTAILVHLPPETQSVLLGWLEIKQDSKCVTKK